MARSIAPRLARSFRPPACAGALLSSGGLLHAGPSWGQPAVRLPDNPESRPSYALSDCGATSSTRPPPSRNTRSQRRANSRLCVTIREVS
jgi:hypothetical protein